MRVISIAINTTGSPVTDGHRITEIGATEILNNGTTGRQFHTYIYPQRDIDKEKIIENGITLEFLKDKKIFSDISGELIEFISNSPLTYQHEETLDFIENEFSLTQKRLELKKAINQPKNQKNTTTEDIFSTALLKSEIQALAYIENNKDNTYINNLTELIEIVKNCNPNDIFRGVSNKDYKLIPSLFRHDESNHNRREYRMMWVFKAQAISHLKTAPENEIQWLTLAQHHGLPTRLLDWSLNPLIACYFAVQANKNKDGAIYLLEARDYLAEEVTKPENIKNIKIFLPTHTSRRLSAQSGVFTIHPDNQPELISTKIRKFIIPSEKKEEIRKNLYQLGINPSTVFPDLDGLSSYIRKQQNYPGN